VHLDQHTGTYFAGSRCHTDFKPPKPSSSRNFDCSSTCPAFKDHITPERNALSPNGTLVGSAAGITPLGHVNEVAKLQEENCRLATKIDQLRLEIIFKFTQLLEEEKIANSKTKEHLFIVCKVIDKLEKDTNKRDKLDEDKLKRDILQREK
jgi:hypothetical protein